MHHKVHALAVLRIRLQVVVTAKNEFQIIIFKTTTNIKIKPLKKLT